MTAYYNEIDPHAAAWLRELIRRGLIAPGDVDERSIEDVAPDDLRGYTQCHFFAGIGGWSLALRLAGWPDDRPVWTGSCPCQPFSSAGSRAGFDDERHLWPGFHWLIRQCRPAVVVGEQVASKAADEWVDLVQADMEGLDYAFGCVAFPSAGVGAPHIRDRNFWVAHATGAGSSHRGAGHAQPVITTAHGSAGVERLAHANGGNASAEREQRGRQQRQQPADGGVERLADGDGDGCCQARERQPTAGHDGPFGDGCAPAGQPAAGPLHGFWRDADWIFCRDGRWRPVEPGTFPLAHGVPARVVRLRGYGNAINPHQAAAFIRAAFG